MLRLIAALWQDDSAAVLSTELILILAIVVFGIVPGLVALRNSLNSSLANSANLLTALTPNVTFSQVGPGQYAVLVNFNVTGTGTIIGAVSGVQVAPVDVGSVGVVPPGP